MPDTIINASFSIEQKVLNAGFTITPQVNNVQLINESPVINAAIDIAPYDISVEVLPAPVYNVQVQPDLLIINAQLNAEFNTIIGNVPDGGLAGDVLMKNSSTNQDVGWKKLSHTHFQNTPSNTWTVTHGLGRNPGGIRVEDSAGADWDPAEIEDVDVNTTILRFGNLVFGGKAIFS